MLLISKANISARTTFPFGTLLAPSTATASSGNNFLTSFFSVPSPALGEPTLGLSEFRSTEAAAAAKKPPPDDLSDALDDLKLGLSPLPFPPTEEKTLLIVLYMVLCFLTDYKGMKANDSLLEVRNKTTRLKQKHGIYHQN